MKRKRRSPKSKLVHSIPNNPVKPKIDVLWYLEFIGLALLISFIPDLWVSGGSDVFAHCPFAATDCVKIEVGGFWKLIAGAFFALAALILSTVIVNIKQSREHNRNGGIS